MQSTTGVALENLVAKMSVCCFGNLTSPVSELEAT